MGSQNAKVALTYKHPSIRQSGLEQTIEFVILGFPDDLQPPIGDSPGIADNCSPGTYTT